MTEPFVALTQSWLHIRAQKVMELCCLSGDKPFDQVCLALQDAADEAVRRAVIAKHCADHDDVDQPGFLCQNARAAIVRERAARRACDVAVREFMRKLEAPTPCGHSVGDLIGAPGTVTQCGACLAARAKKKALGPDGGK